MYATKTIAWHEKVNQNISSKKRLNDHKSVVPVRSAEDDQKVPYIGATEEDLMILLDTTALVHQNMIKLTEATNRSGRLFLLSVLFQASITIVLSVYNLVIYYIRTVDLPEDVEFTISEAMLFHGYNIYRASLEIVCTILGFTSVYYKIDDITRLVNKFYIYANSEDLRNRLLQFAVYAQTSLRSYTLYGAYELNGSLISGIASATVTYIVILTQYGMEFELKTDSNKNQTLTTTTTTTTTTNDI